MMRPHTLQSLAQSCLLLLLVHLCTLIPIDAQSYRPTRTYFASSVFIEGQAMYVLSGYTDDSSQALVGQMFSLDLSTSWSTSSPAFRSLPNGKTDGAIANSLTADNKNWFMISNQTTYLYNFGSSTWSTLYSPTGLSATRGVAAATNPDTGRIYIPNGYFDSITGARSELIYYAQDNTFHYTDMAPNQLSIRYYALVWSPVTKGLLFFGGFNIDTNTTNNNLYGYDPQNGWSMLTTKGDIPTARYSPCFVSAYSGAKMILFGGGAPSSSSQYDASLSDVYVLDVASMTWTRGTDSGSSRGRTGHSCAITNDYLIAWGGYTNTAYVTLDDTVVYNIKTATWTTNYDATKPKSNLAIIIGCSVAGVVLLLAAAGLIFQKQRSKKREAAAVANPTSTVVDGKPAEFIALTNPSQQPYGYPMPQQQQQLQPQPQAQPQQQYQPQMQPQPQQQYQPQMQPQLQQQPQPQPQVQPQQQYQPQMQPQPQPQPQQPYVTQPETQYSPYSAPSHQYSPQIFVPLANQGAYVQAPGQPGGSPGNVYAAASTAPSPQASYNSGQPATPSSVYVHPQGHPPSVYIPTQ